MKWRRSFIVQIPGRWPNFTDDALGEIFGVADDVIGENENVFDVVRRLDVEVDDGFVDQLDDRARNESLSRLVKATNDDGDANRRCSFSTSDAFSAASLVSDMMSLSSNDAWIPKSLHL